MSTLSMSPGVTQKSYLSADELFTRRANGIARRTDRLFAVLLALQWVAAMATAVLWSRLTWAGESSTVHAHVWAAILLGGVIVSLPIALSLARAGATSTRHVVAIAQALMGALLIHLTDGRIETHFHIFGSLALLAFYRDWRVLVTASAIVALDHLVRGHYWPQSVFGVLAASPWRWAEHTAWIIVEDTFLIRSCLQNVQEMRDIAEREADLRRLNKGLVREVTERQRDELELLRSHDELEARVEERTTDLSQVNEGLARAVADRKRAEEAQRRMVAILDATTDFVGIADASKRVLYVNSAGQRMVGINQEDISKASISDYFSNSANEIIAKEVLPTAIRDGAWSGEVAMLRRDGQEIPVSMVAIAHKDLHGNVEFFSAIARDVTERNRANEAKARLAEIVESSVDAIVSKDLSGIVTSWNAGAERLFGYTTEEMVGEPIARLLPPDRQTEELEILERLTRGERVEQFESIRIAKDGRLLCVSLTVSPIRDAAGKVIGASKIARDIADRKRNEQEIRLLNSQLTRRLNRLTALRQIDIAITASFDLGVTLSTLLDQVCSELGVDAADILLLDPKSRTLRYVNGKGFRTNLMQEVPLTLDLSVPGLVASEGIPVHLSDLTQSARPFIRANAIDEEGFVSYSAVPLMFQGVVKGILEVFHRSPLEVDQEWCDFLEALGGQAAIAIDSADLFQNLQRSNTELTVAYDATIEGWSRALDLRDKETEGHTQRVTEMCVNLARTMGITGAALVDVRRGALLHDIGKLGVPDAILLKPGSLTDEEWVLMRRHPTYAYEWLSPIAFLRPALDIPYCHHEKLDGTGYPRGLRGEQIPIAARIFAAVDIWDALRSDRPYRQAWPEERVIEHIRSLAGTHLDPDVVDAFLKYFAADSTEFVADSVTRGTAVAGSAMPAAMDEAVRAEGISHGQVGPPSSGRSGLTILVVEEHPDAAGALQRTLEAKGHDVLLAADGELACGLIEQGRVQVVIADCLMPGLNGPELIRRIRGLAGSPYTYVILVSVRSGEQDRLKALNAGADDFLTKPLDSIELNARLEVARRVFDAHWQLERRIARLTELATTDDLTGLKNRRHFREALESALSLAARERLPLSMVLIDVDHFKRFNDACGHPAGDSTLRTLADILRNEVRPHDILARHGGEEFVLLLNATDADGAQIVAERMRAAVEAHQWPQRQVTTSFGIATLPPDCITVLDLVEAADRALYHSKNQGRNLVTHFDDLTDTPVDRILIGA